LVDGRFPRFLSLCQREGIFECVPHVRPQDDPAIHLLLASVEGKPVNKLVLDLVAEPVEITDEVGRLGELLILKADPATHRRVRE